MDTDKILQYQVLTLISCLSFVMQVQKVKGAFNALGGADRLSSNRMYAH